MNSSIFAGKPKTLPRYRIPRDHENTCSDCRGTFSIKTLECYDGIRCGRCFDKHWTSKGGMYSGTDSKMVAKRFGFYNAGKDVNFVEGSILISDESSETSESESSAYEE